MASRVAMASGAVVAVSWVSAMSARSSTARRSRAPAALAGVVDRPVPGDGRRPPAEPDEVSLEAADVPADLQPGLGGDVLGVGADQTAHVAQQGRLDGR